MTGEPVRQKSAEIYKLQVIRPGVAAPIELIGKQISWIARIEAGHRCRCLGCARRFASGSAVTAFALLSWRGELVGAAGACADCDAKGDAFLLSAAAKQVEPHAKVLLAATAAQTTGGAK